MKAEAPLTVAQLHASFEGGATASAVHGLAYTLTRVAGAEEAPLVAQLEDGPPIVAQAVKLARAARSDEGQKGVVKDVLCALVNLACIGGRRFVREQGGLDLLLESLDSENVTELYFAGT